VIVTCLPAAPEVGVTLVTCACATMLYTAVTTLLSAIPAA
jgi:hypothetical protein